MRRIFFELLSKNHNNHQRIPADGYSCCFPIEVNDSCENLNWYRFAVRKKLTGFDIEFTISHRVKNKIIEHILSDKAIDELHPDIKAKFLDCIRLFIFGDDD